MTPAPSSINAARDAARTAQPSLDAIDREIARLEPLAGAFPFAHDALIAWQWARELLLRARRDEAERT